MGVLASLEVYRRTLFSHTAVAVHNAGSSGAHLDALGLPVKSPGVGLVSLYSEE